ncbi:hypothetical protein CORC01_07991 [Colletotrichum orchidophilum]|uniref:Uncharacterized protein n=1 Tax=Colletotrichum orchidophilum TaxID=1209926 RepID=A0A1G4B5J3_9PEZI|nr:uncharacterized protein CORC01_07991 [Colletotrichum orchidophilum]OHE96674.1 hypothetical protein CORC01_07991 [Colletotrichum orchidophilum]
MKEFMAKHADSWVALAREHGLEEGAAVEFNRDFLHMMLVECDFDREYDLTRSRDVWKDTEFLDSTVQYTRD